MEADFSGYATRSGLKCSDGRTIMPDAFKHQDKVTVPLVWQHMHNEPANILGHAVLENRADGVYTYGYFNKTETAQVAKNLVQHGDIRELSIYANQLVEKSKQVLHGMIREVSLVLSGANPGASIENVNLAHGDQIEVLEDEAIIYTGLELSHADTEGDTEVAETAEKTVKEIFEGLSDEEKDVFYYLVGEIMDNEDGGDAEHSAFDQEEILAHINTSIQEGMNAVTKNIFETAGASGREGQKKASLTHSQMEVIVKDAQRLGSLKESFLEHAEEYGIEDIDFLFPDARTLQNTPEFLSRRMEWVQNVLSTTKHSPFSRIKSIVADITADEARAKGYVKGSLKKDEIIKLLKRVTTPKTIYKKQKLDRDDIIDITDIDVVTWLKGEMRLMLDEEIARAILIGDGREPDDEDKIDEDHIRPIAYDVDMYNTVVNLDSTPTPSEAIEAIIRARKYYKGTGQPTMYTTDDFLTDLLLDKDTLGRRFYNTVAELAAALRVKDIVVVEAMESAADVKAIIVNLVDYTVGADKGGEINMFDDFDIDYNQQKYLIETRISGALTKPKAALTLKVNPGNVVTPDAPTFVASTGVVTIPSKTGVVYKNADTGTTLTAGAQTAIASGATIEIAAEPASGYSFPHNIDADWAFTRD